MLKVLPLRSGIGRLFSTTPSTSVWKCLSLFFFKVLSVVEQTEGDTTKVSMQEVQAETRGPNDMCALCTCTIPVRLSYRDVLILEQFMREDGTVLPKELTGLCKGQQLRLERCVMQAHWAGLFPDKTIADFDRAGYKRFNRYWDDDMSMYRLKEKVEVGSYYYLKRYNTKNNQLKFMPQPLKKKQKIAAE